jgi:quinone-modifying oxidoreductase subunit QmoC
MIEIRPDINFIEKLQRETGSQLTTCMQCGACTASCSLSREQEIFPRKQMIMAAWGLKERLMADPHIWTCHQCGDCSVSCPRDVRPGEIIAALRQEQIAHYSRPRFLSRWMQKPGFLPAVLLFPAIMITLILLLAGTFTIPGGPIDYSSFFPHAWLNISFTALFALTTAGAIAGLRQFARNVQRNRKGNAKGDYWKVFLRIMRHRDFNQCVENKNRTLSHFLVFWGFILLLFVTFFAILSTLLFEYPLSFFNPIKIAGNAGALMLFVGSSLMIFNRLTKRNGLQSSYPDWFFLISFWMLTLSGMLVEGARFHEWSFAYHLYFIHLVLVWIIILYFPYTKFAHFLYRTVALILTRPRSAVNP